MPTTGHYQWDPEDGERTWITWTTTGTASSSSTYTVQATGSLHLDGEQVWARWNNGTAATSTTGTITYAANTAWNSWVQQPTIVRGISAARLATALTPEERAQRDAEAAQRAAEADSRREQAAQAASAARDRARALLRLLLTPEQWAAYDEDRSFVVTAPSGRRYKIVHGYAGNIHLLGDDDGTDERLCIHPPMNTPEGRLPVEDAIAAQVLMLTTDEDELRRVANITPYRQRRAARDAARAHDEGAVTINVNPAEPQHVTPNAAIVAALVAGQEAA